MPSIRKEQRKREHETRMQQRSERTNAEQLARLDYRLGIAVGAEKERQRLEQ